jgi:hypothetical protein
MTAVSGVMLPVGARHLTFYALDANGRPAATSTAVYEGVQSLGVKGFNPNWSTPRTIDHAGGDSLLQRDVLPPITGSAMTINASDIDFALNQIISATNTITIGEAKEVGLMTDKQGFEPQVAIAVWQQVVDDSDTAVAGLRRWRLVVIPKALVTRISQGMGENTMDEVYNVVAQITRQRLWGTTLVKATDGYVRAQAFEYMTEFNPNIVSWKSGSNVATKMLFHADRPAAALTKIHAVTVNGVLDATATKALDGVTPTTIASSDMITCFYEYA